MNEQSTPVAFPPSPPRPQAVDQLRDLVLGPNEDQLLPFFLPHTPCVNLLPKKQPPSWVALGSLALMVVLALIGGTALGLGWATRQAESELQEVQRLTTERKSKLQRYQLLQRQVEAIDGQMGAYVFVTEGSPHWADILDRLRDLMPGGVHLSQVEGDAAGTLLIRGTADSLKSVGSFMLNLRGSGYFYEPRLGMGNRPAATGSGLVEYDLAVRVAHGDWLSAAEEATSSAAPAAGEKPPADAEATP